MKKMTSALLLAVVLSLLLSGVLPFSASAQSLSMGINEGATLYGGGGVTNVEYLYTASETGYVTEVTFDVYPGTVVNGLVIGAAEHNYAMTYTCRSRAELGSGFTEGNHTVTGLHMYVMVGDSLMIYTSSFTVGTHFHAGGGFYWSDAAGDTINVGSEITYNHNTQNYMFSMVALGSVDINLPIAETLGYNSLGEHQVELLGNVTFDGNQTCTGRFSYGTITPFTFIQTGNITDLHTGDTFGNLVEGLMSNTNYWFIAEVENDTGVDVGDYMTFTTNGSPFGETLDVGNVTDHSAVFNAHCIFDGGNLTTATFKYAGTGIPWDNPVEIVFGNVSEGQYFSIDVIDLTPSTLYGYWVYFENAYGNYSSSPKYFQTVAGIGPDVPIVQTLPATFVTNTSAVINGFLAYDGNLDCYLGFRYRQQGASDWIEGMHSSASWHLGGYATYRSPQSFSNTLNGLAIDTIYEYEALAKNDLARTGVFGNITTFFTGHAGAPTVTPRPIVPDNIHLSPSVKIFLALLVTVLSMAALGYALRSAPLVGVVCAVAAGLMWLIAFSAWGYLPGWVILAIVIILGMVILLIVLARR
jgi:hypothetical protein